MQLGNWVRQTTTTTGTGNLTLSSVSGWATFASQFAQGADGAGDYFYYTILDDSTSAPLEAGIGRMSDSTTMVRHRVLASLSGGTYSEANTALSLPAGTKRVICADLAHSRPLNASGVRASATDRYFGTAHINTAGGNSKTLNTGLLYVVPFEVRTAGVFSGMAINVSTGAGSSSVRLGLYRLNANLEPGGLIDSTGDIVTTAVGWASSGFLGGSKRLRSGWYYAALKSFGGTPAVFAAEGSGRIISQAGTLSVSTAGSGFVFGTATSTPQALPDPSPAIANWVGALSDFTPMVYLVAAAP